MEATVTWDVFALKMIEIAPLSPLDYGLDVDLFHKIATEEISPDTLEKMIDFDVVYVKMDRARLHVCLWNYLLVAGAERKHIGGKQALHVNLSCNQPIRPVSEAVIVHNGLDDAGLYASDGKDESKLQTIEVRPPSKL